jgi:antitoxin (DNA-binding transcriptional repressor) of toxin-antitoxin stability system
MKFIGVRDFRGRTAGVWAQLQKEKEMVITSNGKPVALLTAVNEDNFEGALKTLRRARAIAATESMREHAMRRGLDKMSLHEINEVIRKTREENDARRS